MDARPRTLRQHFDLIVSQEGGPRQTNPLLDVYFSDKNIAAIEAAVAERVRDRINDLADSPEAVTVLNSLPLRNAVFQIAMEHRLAPMTQPALLAMNRNVVERAAREIQIDLVYQARMERYRKYGARPSDIARPVRDENHADKLEASKAIFGHNRVRTNPFETMYGGAIRTFDQFWNLAGTNPRAGTNFLSQRTGSDEYRVKLLKDVPVFRVADAGIPDSRKAPYTGDMGPAPVLSQRMAGAALSNVQTSMGPAGQY